MASSGCGTSLAILTLLLDRRPLAINAEGHYRSDEDVTDAIVYVVQTAGGQQTLTPAEFSAKYGWQNDPSKVKLLAPYTELRTKPH